MRDKEAVVALLGGITVQYRVTTVTVSKDIII